MNTRESAALPPVSHGGLQSAELRTLGIEPGSIIDFSANVNPLGPSPRVREALASLDLSRYPDPECRDLRVLLAERHGVGIGLATCRELTKAMGGSIWVEPREGGGSVFTFTLPLLPD